MSDFTAKINAILDTKHLQSQLKAIQDGTYKIKVQTDISGVRNFTDSIKNQMQNAGNSAGDTFVTAFNSSLNKIHLKNGSLGNIKNILHGAGFDKQSIAVATKDLEKMILSINKITTKQTANGNIKMTISGADEIGRAVQVVREFDKVTGRVSNTSKTFVQSFDGNVKAAKRFEESVKNINAAIGRNEIESSIAKVASQYEKLGTTGHSKLTQIKSDIEMLKKLQAQFNTTSDGKTLVRNYEKFNETLAKVRNNLTTVSAESKMVASSLQIKTLDNRMSVWMQNNSRAAKDFGSSIDALRAKLKTMSASGTMTTTQLKSIESEFKSVTIAAQQAGKLGKTFGDTFKSSFASITRYVSASTLIFTAVNTLRQGITTVKELDSSLIDLQKTAQATASQLTDFYYEANNVAKEYGATTREIIQSAADWSRLGYSLPDSKLMAQYSSMFKSISPGMDIDTATSGLVSIMKAYGIEANDVLDGVMSKINEVGNTAATSNDQIVEGLQRSSAALATMGTGLDESIALFTAGQEIMQDASQVGNALKTISMRVRGYNEETEELDESLVNITGDVIDLTKTASNPKGVSLFTDETQTEYKSVYTYLQEISKIYDELSAKQQQQLLEKLFGKNRASVGAAILENFSAAEKAMTTMTHSAGSAEAEMSTIAESLEYKLNALKETGTGIFQNLFKREDFGAVVDALTSILGVVDTLTEKLGLFGTIGVGVGLTAFIKNFEKLKELGKFTIALKEIGKGATDINLVTNAVKGLSTANAAAVVSTTALSNADKVAILMSTGLSAAEAEEALAAASAATANAAAGTAAAGASVGFAGLAASVKAAAAGLATFLFTNPVGWAILAVGAIVGVVKAVDALTESFEEAQEKSAESREAYQQTTSEVEQLNSELETTQSRINELKAQGSLSVVEKAELAELQAQNEQLQRQIEIKEKLANMQGKQAAADANNVLTKKTQSATEWIDDKFDQDWDTSNDARDIITRTEEKQRQLNQYKSDRNKLYEEQSKLTPEYSNWLESDTQYEKNQRQLENYEKQIDTLEKEIAENIDSINTEYNSLFDTNGNIISGYEDTAQRCEDLFDYTLSSGDKALQVSEKIDSIFSKPTLSNFKDELVDIAANSDNVGITADDVKTKYSELADACEDAGVDIQDLVDYINSTADIIDVDEVKSQLSEAFDISDEQADFDSFLNSLSVDELKVLYSIYESNDTSGWSIEDFQQAMDDLQLNDITVNIEANIKNTQEISSEIKNLQSVLSSQATGNSISIDTFNSDELKDYQSALEYVNGSMQLNADKAREIAQAKVEEQTAINNANKELSQAKYMENINQIESLKRQLSDKNNLTDEEIQKMQQQISECETQNAGYLAECDQLDILNASLRESISTYNKWKAAQGASESGDMFDDTLTAIKNINDTLNDTKSENYGRVGRKDFLASVDLIIPESVDSEDEQAINNYLNSIESLFTFDDDGKMNGLNIEAFCEQAVKKGLMVLDESSDEYKVAGGKTMADFANGMNLSMPLVQAMFGELEEFGASFDWGDEIFTTFGDGIVAAQKQISELETEIDSLQKQKAAGVDIDDSKIKEAQKELKELKKQKEELTQKATVNIETNMELDSKLKDAESELEGWKTKLKDKNLSAETKVEVQANVDAAQEKIEKLQKKKDKLQEPTQVEIQASLGDIDSKIANLQTQVNNFSDKEYCAKFSISEEDANAKVSELQGKISNLQDKKAKIETYAETKQTNNDLDALNKKEISDKDFTVSATDKATSVINRINNMQLHDKNVTITTTERTVKKSEASGSAHMSGTAKASGDWRDKQGGETLVGELGREIVVNPHTGKWYTVGDNGAEFVNVPKNAIVFNHQQTEDLLAHGYVASRAVALANGTALASGTAMVTGGIKRRHVTDSTNRSGYNSSSSVTSGSSQTTNTPASTSTSNNTTKNTDDKKKDSKEDKALEKFKKWISKLFDWIEIRLERQAKKIDRFTTRADNASDAGKYNTAAKNYRNALSSTATQIRYEQIAESKYNKQGDKVLRKAVKNGIVSQKTADGIAKKVKNGTMNIKKYSERMQEVIKDYQTWYDKSQDAKDAITELHNNIRKYITDLKDLRDAQRDAKIDSLDTFTSIGTSGVANSTRAQNSQLNYTNKQLTRQNAAYDTEVTKVTSDTNAIGKKGTKSVNKALRSKDAKKNQKYKKALRNARKAIKAKKPIASTDLKVIKANSISVYNNLYAYNLALDNIETAKLEQAANYASTSADTYKNIADSYSNKDDATNDKISLLKQKASNATSVKKKNNYLAQIASQYDTILANDAKEVAEYNKAVNSNKKAVTKKAGTTTKYKKADKKTKNAVKKAIKSAKAAVKKKKSIPASTLSSLAKYYSKGYVTKAFYEACIDYNNALENLDLAKEQQQLDTQEAIAEKAAIGTEMVNNVEQKYTNKLNTNANKTQRIQNAQSLKTTRGLSLTASDYQKLINQSKKDQQIYSDAAEAISAQIQSNLANGYWTTDSQEYKDAIQTMNEYSQHADECKIEQEEWNNAIAELPYSNLEKILSLLDSIKSNYESLLSINAAKGLTETESQYLQQIANVNAEIERYKELRQQAWNDYQTALNSTDGVYGGKTADEWLETYYDYDTSINNLTADIVELNNSIANLPYESFQKIIDLLESVQSYNDSAIDLKTAFGLDLDESDYEQQMSDNSQQISQYEQLRQQAYADYLKALADPEGVYGGKTANEWLAAYNEYGTTINNLTADNEKLKDSLRDDVYWRTFERAHEAAQRFHNVLSGLSDLIDDDMYFDNDGNLTEYGVAQVANLVSEYENARKEVQNYQADINNLNKLYAEGYYTEQEYTEKLNELQGGLLDSASSMKEFSDSIVQMYKNMAQSELDALMDLIDARNDALSAKKA